MERISWAVSLRRTGSAFATVLGHRGLSVVLLAAIADSACGGHGVTVEYRESDYRFSSTERNAIQRIVDDAAMDTRVFLPSLPPSLVLRVNADDNVSDVTGAAGTFDIPNIVYWTVDPHRGDNVVAVAERHLRSTLFHEFHHLVRDRDIPRVSLLDHVISEGMASAFERDFAGATYPWAEYPENVSAWVAEIMAVPATGDLGQWMYRHPDGRRWIGFRAGTYLVDRAIKTSGQSAAELVSIRTQDVLRLAEPGR